MSVTLSSPTNDTASLKVNGIERMSFSDDGTVGIVSEKLSLGGYHLWVDSTGKLRINNGVPTSDTDGVVVGSQ